MPKIKLVPKKKVAPIFLPYVCAIFYILIMAILVVCLIEENFMFSIGIGAIIVSLVIFNYCFSWYKEAEIYETNNFVLYRVKNIIGVLGRDITEYHINRIDLVKLKGDNIVVEGAITVYEPMTKGKEVKRVVINDGDKEIVSMLTKCKFYIDK